MKKILMMAALAATAIFTTSCSDDELTRGVAKTGTPINFSASTRSMSTRTAYGIELNGGKWDINWVNGDQVTVFCPEASTEVDGGETKADFSLSAIGNSTIYGLNDTEQSKLYWGEADMHHFYEVYPADKFGEITTNADAEATVTANLPATQYATMQPDGFYADMSCALMAGATSESRLDAPSSIILPFSPITTAIDITIYPVAKSDKDSVFTINGIQINSVCSDGDPQPIAGKFTYTFSEQDNVYSYASVEDEELVSFNVAFQDKDGNSVKPALKYGDDPLKVTVFLRGDFGGDNNSIKVTVQSSLSYKSGGTTDIDPLVITKKSGIYVDENEVTHVSTFTSRARNHINLGHLTKPEGSRPVNPDDPDPIKPGEGSEWWVWPVNDDVYVSQMSLPGVYDACSFLEGQTARDRAQNKLWTNESNKYYEQVKAYLNAGNRVLDMKPTYENGKWVVGREMSNGGHEEIDFEAMVKAVDDWLSDHVSEFVIFLMSDYNTNVAEIADISKRTSAAYQANISKLLRNTIPARRLVESFDADIKVKDARGKILVINESPCDDPVGISPVGWQLNKPVVYQGGTCLSDGLDDVTSPKKGYDSFDYPMGTGHIYVQDWNNVDNAGNANVTSKQSHINNVINMASQSTSEKNWYLTSITFRRAGGQSTSASPGYGEVSDKLRTGTITKIQGLSNSGTYQSCGIIMQAYSADPKLSENQRLEYIIWQNNYKANGPQRAPSGH